MMPQILLIGLPAVLGILAIIGAAIYRAGVRRGVRKSTVNAQRAYNLGNLYGRREERVDWISKRDL